MMKLAVLGNPISHSLSPKIHEAAYQILGIPADYTRFEVSEESFSGFMKSHTSDDWRGFSLTMPLKEVSLEICGEIESSAQSIGAINTLVAKSKFWSGFNTDISGFEFLLATCELNDVAILGAGGTAKAALYALRDIDVPIKVYRRDARRDALLRQANELVEILPWSQVNSAFKASHLINTLPIQAFDHSFLLTEPVGQVIDALYYPWPTPLMKIAKEKVIFTGKDLLVAQALRQIELFSGYSLDKPGLFKELRKLI